MRTRFLCLLLVGIVGCSRVNCGGGEVAPPVPPETDYQSSGDAAWRSLGDSYADVYEAVAVKLERLEPGETISSDEIEKFLRAELPKARASAIGPLEDDLSRWCPRNRPLTRDDAKVYRGIGRGWRR